MPWSDITCFGFVDLWEIWGKSTARAKASCCEEQPLKEVGASAPVRWSETCGHHQGRASSVARLMETQIWLLHVPTSHMRGGLNKGTMSSARTSVSETTVPPALALKPGTSDTAHRSLMLFKQLSLCWSLRWVWKTEPVLGLFKKMPGSTVALHLAQTESLLIFHSRMFWGVLFPVLVSQAGEPCIGIRPLTLQGDLHS